MDTFYQLIEDKIKESGYTGTLDGEDIYNEICDQIEEKEPGTYLVMSKKGDDFFIEYQIDVYEDQFNLSFMDIHTSDQVYHVNFD